MTRQKHRKRRVRDRAAKTGESYTVALRHVRFRQEEASVSTTNEDSRTVEELVVECSFCGKSQKEVQKLVAGPGVYICDECVGLCNTIFEAEAGDVPRASVPEVLDVLHKMDAAKKSTRSWVAFCLRLGATWQQVGEVVGMSAEEAERRLSPTD